MGAFGWAEKLHRTPLQAYKVSKAALNMLHKITSLDLADQGFTLVAISPGVSCPLFLHRPPQRGKGQKEGNSEKKFHDRNPSS